MCVLLTLLFAPPTFSSCSLAHLRLAAGNAFIKLVKDRKELSLAFSDFLQVSLVSQVGTYVHTYLQVTARTSASFLQTHPQPNCSPSLLHLTHTPHTSHPHPTHTSSTPHLHLTHTHLVPSLSLQDPCLHVRTLFLQKLHKGLATCKLPLSYLAILCLYGDEEDKALKAAVSFL